MGLINISKNKKNKKQRFIQSVDNYNMNNGNYVNFNNQNMNYNNNYPSNHQNNYMASQTPDTYSPSNLNNEAITPSETPNPANYESTEVLAEDLPETLDENEALESSAQEPILDPLNNANNPIPVNPTSAPIIEEEEDDEELNAKASIFAVAGLVIGMVLKPGQTIINNNKKYKSFSKALTVTICLTIITLLACIGVRILIGSFSRSYSAITGSYSINFNLGNVFDLANYTQYLIIAFIASFVSIFVISLIYYASSFFNSKGVHFGSYLAVSNVTVIPLIIGIVILNPVLSILSNYLGIIGIIVPFIYSLICFIIGINQILKFKNLNSQIYYNVFNISLIIFVMYIIVMILMHFNILIMPDIII